MGRTTSFAEYNSDGSTAYTSISTYAANNDQLTQTQDTYTGSSDQHSVTSFDYKLDVGSATYTGAYEGGQVVHSHTVTTTGSASVTSDTVNAYAWGQSVRETGIRYTPDVTASTVNTTTFSYDSNSNLSGANIVDGAPRTLTYVTTPNGQVMSRVQAPASGSSAASTTDDYYYFDGVQVGSIGNDGTAELDFASAIKQHNPTTGTAGVLSSNFGDNPQPIDPVMAAASPTSADTRYTVQTGDTLNSIAQSLWGDGSLWYLIADDNSLSGSETLTAGQVLNIPSKVTDVHNSSSTFTVYDPSKAIGNVSPTTPRPVAQSHHNNDCGGVGEILVAIIAVAVTAVVLGPAVGAVGDAVDDALGASTVAGEGAAAEAAGDVFAEATFDAAAASIETTASVVGDIVGGAIAGGVGSFAGQAFGVATGIQDHVSWSGVALAALSAGINGGLSDAGIGGGGIEGATVRGVLGGALTQGIGVATGLQSKFDWGDVAAAGISAGVGYAVTDDLGGYATGAARSTNAIDSDIGGVAGAIVGAASKSVLTGTDFGTNLKTLLPSVIGQTIGNAIAGGLTASETPQQPEPSAQTGNQGGAPTDAAHLSQIITTPETITPVGSELAPSAFGDPGPLSLPPDIQLIADGGDSVGGAAAAAALHSGTMPVSLGVTTPAGNIRQRFDVFGKSIENGFFAYSSTSDDLSYVGIVGGISVHDSTTGEYFPVPFSGQNITTANGQVVSFTYTPPDSLPDPEDALARGLLDRTYDDIVSPKLINTAHEADPATDAFYHEEDVELVAGVGGALKGLVGLTEFAALKFAASMAPKAAVEAAEAAAPEIVDAAAGSAKVAEVALDTRFATSANEAVFWSGRTEGIGGADAAAEIAKSQGGTTLEQLTSAKGIDLPVWDASNPESMQAWDEASRNFAQQASGDVHVVLGDTVRPGSVWERIEFPTLQQNQNITSITRIDPATGARSIIFRR